METDSLDTLSPEERSARMGLVKSRNTKPEMRVRRLTHAMGYRYRLHGGGLPGKPDLVFAGRKKVIFVHGCFWHRHPSPECKLARLPKSRLDFWIPKLEKNRERDVANQKTLRDMGWDVLTLWECELRSDALIAQTVKHFLELDHAIS
jgi:DNA mismatch endonuclease, patch repair protein